MVPREGLPLFFAPKYASVGEQETKTRSKLSGFCIVDAIPNTLSILQASNEDDSDVGIK